MADIDLKEIRDFLVDIAYNAGRMIRSADPSASALGSKKNSVDLVTETDQKVEKMICSRLAEQYPHFKFLGEETYKPGDKLTMEPTFVVDPIDGTTNFVHGFPYVSVSLGLAVEMQPLVGVVYNPFTETMYSAIRGHGAFRNQTTPLPLNNSVTPLDSLNDALVALEWGSDRAGNDYDVKIRTFTRLGASKESGGAMVHSVRSLGSAALNICAVAEGTLDVYWEGGCWPWDVCAGWVVLKEAGGLVADGNPGNWEPLVDDRRYLFMRAGASKQCVEEFWSCIEGRLSYSS